VEEKRLEERSLPCVVASGDEVDALEALDAEVVEELEPADPE
jgi:hypothetical protein